MIDERQEKADFRDGVEGTTCCWGKDKKLPGDNEGTEPTSMAADATG
jgi:hypothetical protein